MNPKFEAALGTYRVAIGNAIAERAHHDQRRALFFEFLHDGFGLSAETVELEKGLYGLKTKGLIDALYKDLVIEFKRDLGPERETGKAELQKYLATLKTKGRHFGILTDGVTFEVYLPGDDALTLVDEVKLLAIPPSHAFIWLDKYFFSAKVTSPSADDLRARFGPASPVFLSSMDDLTGLFAQVRALPSVEVKVDQWGKLLARVYGSEIGDDQLFLRHTYLAIVARLLSYLALFGTRPTHGQLDGLISGKIFRKEGLLNFVEEDFFAWLLEVKVLAGTRGWLWNLAQYFNVYEVKSLTGDLLKELYQVLVDPETRHDLGEFYTPDWLATLTLEEAKFSFPQSVLDPACGSGTFLAAAIRLARVQGAKNVKLVDWVLNDTCGIDVHPLAVTIAKATLVISLASDLRKANRAVVLPIYMADAIPKFEPGVGGPVLIIPTGSKHSFGIPIEIAKEASKLDKIIEDMLKYANAEGDDQAVVEGFGNLVKSRAGAQFVPVWANNLRLLRRYIKSGRNTVWAYILKNQYRPLFAFYKKYDLVAGNPPWLAYQFVKEPTYQAQIRSLTFEYGLLEASDVRSLPHMDTSTLFFFYSADRYAKTGGRVAFVMPYSVTTGAKVHTRFHTMQAGPTKLACELVIDCKDVEPLFNVPTCVVVARREA